MKQVVVLAHDIRSTHNVGSLFRTSEGFGVERIIFSGCSPYPELSNDTRLPHIVRRLSDQIRKTALGAETIVPFDYYEQPPLDELRAAGYRIVALEQSETSVTLPSFHDDSPIALLLGEERYGITPELLTQCDAIVEIPMSGQKESFNVSVAAGIALYQICYR